MSFSNKLYVTNKDFLSHFTLLGRYCLEAQDLPTSVRHRGSTHVLLVFRDSHFNPYGRLGSPFGSF